MTHAQSFLLKIRHLSNTKAPLFMNLNAQDVTQTTLEKPTVAYIQELKNIPRKPLQKYVSKVYQYSIANENTFHQYETSLREHTRMCLLMYFMTSRFKGFKCYHRCRADRKSGGKITST